MDLIPRKYFLFVLAAALVVALGYMAVKTSRVYYPTTTVVETPNYENAPYGDDGLDLMEKEVKETDYSGVNEDLEQISKELDSE